MFSPDEAFGENAHWLILKKRRSHKPNINNNNNIEFKPNINNNNNRIEFHQRFARSEGKSQLLLRTLGTEKCRVERRYQQRQQRITTTNQAENSSFLLRNFIITLLKEVVELLR